MNEDCESDKGEGVMGRDDSGGNSAESMEA